MDRVVWREICLERNSLMMRQAIARLMSFPLLSLSREAIDAWLDDRAASLGAALAYYTLFSLAPLLLIVVSVAGLVFGAEAARGEIFDQISGLMGPTSAAAIELLLASVNWPAGNVLGTLIGICIMIIGATTVFAELQNAFDQIWQVSAQKRSGLWAMLRGRVLSFGLVLGVGFLLIVSLLFSAAVAALQKWWMPEMAGWEVLLGLLNTGIGFTLLVMVFAMIYKFMPRARIAWADVWVGSLVTATLFTWGRSLIGLYLGHSAVASGFGAASSLVVVLVWIYYSAQIFLLGAEFTWVYARRYGSQRASDSSPESPKGK